MSYSVIFGLFCQGNIDCNLKLGPRGVVQSTEGFRGFILSWLTGSNQKQFVSVINTFVSSHPAIAALVWGAMRLTILAASNFSTFFEKMTSWFMRMQSCCPRFKEYQLLFPDSPRLQEALCYFYACLIQFCTRSVEAMNRSGQCMIFLMKLFVGSRKI